MGRIRPQPFRGLFNSLVPGWCGSCKSLIFEHMFMMLRLMSTSCEIALRWIPQISFDGKSRLVRVSAWCCQATSHYLSHYWSRSMWLFLAIRIYSNPWCFMISSGSYKERYLHRKQQLAELTLQSSSQALADDQGTLLLTWINFNPTWISYYIKYKVSDEITHPFPNFNIVPVSLGMDM